MRRSSRFTVALSLCSLSVIAASCGSGVHLDNNNPAETTDLAPPQGMGGHFDPGDGGPSSYGANGYGAAENSQSGTTSAGGMDAGMMDEPLPPMCTDDLKRCAHEFTYPIGSETSVELRGSYAPGAWSMGAAMTKSNGLWRVTVEIPYNQEVDYKFWVNGSMWLADPANTMTMPDGNGGVNSVLSPLTCADFTCDSPPALGYDWRDAIMYFVFVDRFVNGDTTNDAPIANVPTASNYQGGDWKGLLSKIQDGYFTDLGVNTLWLTVPMDNTSDEGIGSGTDTHEYSGYHGYWPNNLEAPEEHFGTMDDLKAVVDAAHAKNIKILIDYAMNHVYQASPTYTMNNGWFWPNAYMGHDCLCGFGCSYDDPTQSKMCWFAPYLPTFDFQVDDARKYSVANAVQWLTTTGADGFRLDAVKQIETSWISDLRAAVTTQVEPTSKQHVYMVGETFTGDKTLIKSLVDPTNLLDGQFDFPLRVQLANSVLIRNGSMADVDGFLNANNGYYGSAIMSTFIGNADVPRAINFAQDNPSWTDPWADGKDKNWSNQPALPAGTSAFQRLGNAFAILFTTPGIPLIYYGDEIGLPGGGDPDNRRMMTFDGLSDGQSLLLAEIKKLTVMRAAHPAVRKGQWQSLGSSMDTTAYSMTYDGDTVIVAVNRGDQDQSVTTIPPGTYIDQLSGAMVVGPNVTVPARSALVLVSP